MSATNQKLIPLIEQLCRDLNEAHNEILRQQGVAEADFNKFDWPEWSPQANSIRWAERETKTRLAKTCNWTLYPSTEQVATAPSKTGRVDLPSTEQGGQYANYHCAGCGGKITNGYCVLCASQPTNNAQNRVQCADCLDWIDRDASHTCRQQIRRNQAIR